MLRNLLPRRLPSSLTALRSVSNSAKGKIVGHESTPPSAIDSAASFLFFTEIARGMAIAHEQIFRQPYTIMYPFEKGPLSPRFRGEHALRRYPTGKSLLFQAIGPPSWWRFVPISRLGIVNNVTNESKEKNGALLVNFVKQFVQPWQSLLKRNLVRTDHAKQLVTILT
jgi:hypothetical protein